MNYPQGRIMVFCKAPEPGKVMTRLAKALNNIGHDGNAIAARVHEFLALERLEQVTREALAPVELWCSPDKTHSFFRTCEERYPLVLKDQPEGDLGFRMSFAFDEALSVHPYAVLIGTDCPGLNSLVLDQAMQYLHDKKCSVIGPAEDGGYVLIGLTSMQGKIFENMEWGSSQVCNRTIDCLQGEVVLLPTLWDLDRIEDLRRLISESGKLGLSQEFIRYLDTINLQ